MTDKNQDEKEKVQNVAIPDSLPGLNIKEGMKRLGGTCNMYADLVRFFCNDKKGFPADFRNLVEQKDFKNASILAHSLKGSAATISAIELSEAAKRLEKICGETEDREQIMDILQIIEDKLSQVITSSKNICALLQTDKRTEDYEETDETDDDSSDIFELIEQLSQCLQEFDPLESERYVKRLKRRLRNGDFNSVALDLAKNVEKQIRSYEFEAAGKILNYLRLLIQ